jgi:predicted nuclease with TOPRIM domain
VTSGDATTGFVGFQAGGLEDVQRVEKRAPTPVVGYTSPEVWQNQRQVVDDNELIAQELSDLAVKIGAVEARLAEVENVNARLEEAALTTARAMAEISRHWDAVYDAMTREEVPKPDASSERDNAAARKRREG